VNNLAILKLAAAAEVNPRTVKRYLTGAVRSKDSPQRRRIAKTLEAFGLGHLTKGVPPEAA
jgi:hypothetical protein